MAIEELEGKDTNVYSRKGVFIPDITVEMFRNASLEGVGELMASGEMEDISLPSAQPERPKGEWITDDLSGMIYCSRCGNAAPMETTGGRQYKSKFCQTCGAEMRGEQDDEQASTIEVEEALNMAINALAEQRWIPVTERMPEEHEWLGTKRFGTTISDDVYVTFENPKGERFCKHLSFQSGKLSGFDQSTIDAFYKGSKPIAWMPLPEPYQAERREE